MAARLGLVAALPGEVSCLVSRPLQSGQGSILGESGLIQLSGPGMERAYRAAQTLVQSGANALLSWGVAGALDGSLTAGIVILPESILAPDGEQWDVDSGWYARVSNRIQPEMSCRSGRLATSECVLSEPHQKAVLHQTSHAIAVDMESAGVARAGAEARIPCLAIRVIVDRQQWVLPSCVTMAVGPHGVRVGAMARRLLGRPAELPHMFRLIVGWRAAQAAMRGIVASIGPEFMLSAQR